VAAVGFFGLLGLVQQFFQSLADAFTPTLPEVFAMFAVGIMHLEADEDLANFAANRHKPPMIMVDLGVGFGSEWAHKAM
jgi:hypothetical protein